MLVHFCRSYGSVRKEELGAFPSTAEEDGREGKSYWEHWCSKLTGVCYLDRGQGCVTWTEVIKWDQGTRIRFDWTTGNVCYEGHRHQSSGDSYQLYRKYGAWSSGEDYGGIWKQGVDSKSPGWIFVSTRSKGGKSGKGVGVTGESC